MRNLIFVFVIVSLCFSDDMPLAGSSGGRIEGTVQDELGVPLAGIRVYLSRADGRIKLNVMRNVEADNVGHFVFDKLNWGRYRIYAMNEMEGYPDTTFGFYARSQAPLIELSPQKSSTTISVTMGPKAGIISGTVVDKVTREPVNPTFRLTDIAEPSRWISTGVTPHFRILVPAATNISVEVTAPGYRAWYYNGTLEKSNRSPCGLAPKKKYR